MTRYYRQNKDKTWQDYDRKGERQRERERDRVGGGREEKEEIIAPAKLKIALSSFPRCK